MNKVLLGDVAEEVRENYKETDGNPAVVGLEHLIPGEIRLKEWSKDTNTTFTKAFHKGQVLFGRRRAYLKKAAVASVDGICSGDITVISAKQDKILPELLPFVIQNDDFFDFAVGKSAGSLSPRVKWSKLKEYEFNLPSLPQQRKLAKLLWSFVDAKEAYEDLIRQTDELVKSQFIEMITEHSNGFKAIGDLVETKIEKVKDLPEFIHSIKYIDISSLDNERKCVTGYTEYELSKSPSRAQQVIEKGDILLSTVRPNLEGRAVNQYEGDNIVASTGFCILRAKKCEPAYIWGIISSRQFVTDICEIAHGISYPAVSDKDILGYMAPDLDDQYQKQYADILEQSDKSKFELNEAIKDLDAMYKRIIKDNLG